MKDFIMGFPEFFRDLNLDTTNINGQLLLSNHRGLLSSLPFLNSLTLTNREKVFGYSKKIGKKNDEEKWEKMCYPFTFMQVSRENF